MATLIIPNICGANANLGDVLNQVNSLKNSLKANLEAEASTMASALTSDLTTLNLNVKKLIPDIPNLPAIPLQAEVLSLLNIDKSTVQGLAAFTSKLIQLKSQFGPALKDRSLDLDKLLVAGAAAVLLGKDICNLVPNLKLPSGGTAADVIEKSVNSLIPDKGPTPEIASLIVTAKTFAAKAQAAQLERKELTINTATTAIKSIKTVIARGAGTVTPEQRTLINKADALMKTTILSNPLLANPTALVYQSAVADVTYLDTKDETTGKYPTGTSNTEVDEYLKTTATTNEKKKREFETLLMSEYAKFKSWSDAFMNLIKTAQSEYPHNVTSDGKEMYIWGDDKVIPYTGRRTGKNFTTTAKSMKSAQVKTAASMKERITSTLEFAALHNAWDVSDHEDILGPESRRDTLKSLTLTWAHCYSTRSYSKN